MKRSVFLSTVVIAVCCATSLSQTKVRNHLVHDSNSRLEESPSVMQTGTYADRKSVTLAVVYSLILPGMGEWYAESFSSGKYALMAEGGLWVTYAGFRMHGNWLRSDGQSFATQHAGANFTSKDEQFDVALGNYLTTADYNDAKLRQRQTDQLYPDPSSFWNWDSDGNRLAFRQLRVRSDEAYQNAKFVIGGLVVNRLISAFMAGRAASAYNRGLRAEGDWQLRANPSGGLLGAYGLELELRKEF